MKSAAQQIHDHLQEIERAEISDYQRGLHFDACVKPIFQVKRQHLPEKITQGEIARGRNKSGLDAVLTSTATSSFRKKGGTFLKDQTIFSTGPFRNSSAPKATKNYSRTIGMEMRVNEFRLSSSNYQKQGFKTTQNQFSKNKGPLRNSKRAKSSSKKDDLISFLNESPERNKKLELFDFLERQEDIKRQEYFSAHEERMARMENSMNEVEKRMTEALRNEMAFAKPKKDQISLKKQSDMELREFEIQRQQKEKEKHHQEIEELMRRIKEASNARHESRSGNPLGLSDDFEDEPPTPRGELTLTPRNTFKVNFPKIRTKNAEPDLPVREETFLTKLERLHEQKERELMARHGIFPQEEEDDKVGKSFYFNQPGNNQEDNYIGGDLEKSGLEEEEMMEDGQRIDNLVSNQRKNLNIYDDFKLIEIDPSDPRRVDSKVDIELVKAKIQEAKVQEQKRYERLFSTFKLYQNKDGWLNQHEKKLENTHFYTSFTHEAKVGNLLLIPFPKFCINRVFYFFNYKVPSEKYCSALCVFLLDNCSRLTHMGLENNSMSDQMCSKVIESLFLTKESNTIRSLRIQKNSWDKMTVGAISKGILSQKMKGLSHLSLLKGSGAKNPVLMLDLFKSLRDGATTLETLQIGDVLLGGKAFEMLYRYLESRARQLQKVLFDNFTLDEAENAEKLFALFCQSCPSIQDLRVTNLHAPSSFQSGFGPKGHEEDIRLLESLRHMHHLNLENSDIPCSVIKGLVNSILDEKNKEISCRLSIQSIHLPLKTMGKDWISSFIKDAEIKKFEHVPLVSDSVNLECFDENDLGIRGTSFLMPVVDFQWQEDYFSLRYRDKIPFLGYTNQSKSSHLEHSNSQEQGNSQSFQEKSRNLVLFRIDDAELDQERDWHWGYNCWICERWRKIKIKCRYSENKDLGGSDGPKERTYSIHSNRSQSINMGGGSPPRGSLFNETSQMDSSELPFDSEDSFSEDSNDNITENLDTHLTKKLGPRRSSVSMNLGNCFFSSIFFGNKKKAMSFSYSDKSYEFVTYLPPGLSSYSIEMIFDHSPYPFVVTEGSLLIKPRESDPPKQSIEEEKGKKKKEFDFAGSVFKNYVQESKETYEKMLENDLKFSKVAGLFRKKNDFQILKESMHRKNVYKEIYWIFVQLAAQSAWPIVKEKVLSGFLASCKVVDGYLTQRVIEQTYVSSVKKDKETNENSGSLAPLELPKAFMRFQFVEVIVRLSLAKYIDSHRLALATEAVERFVFQDLLPFQPSGFDVLNTRKEKIHTDPVSKLLETNLPFIMKISNKFKQQDGSVPIKSIRLILKDTSLVLSEQEINSLASQSKMWVINEKKEQAFAKNLVFVEFLEFLVRLGAHCFQKEALIGDDYYKSTLKVLEAFFDPLKIKPIPAKGIK